MQLDSIYCCNGKEFPEELCFYRDSKKWFVFISHEKRAGDIQGYKQNL